MNKAFIALVLVIAASLALVSARNYAVLVAGSNSYSNYRHQSDIAHHYQILRSRGFESDDIITFMYDDLAQARSNPFPGTTFNTPSETEGTNYYQGIKIDYSGRDVTPDNFLKVIVGNSTTTDGPTLKTGPNDNILISMDDHGAPGLFAFPTQELYVSDFKKALDYIIAQNKASKVAVYIEACESGSMCMNVIPAGNNVVCLTASDEHLSSWAKYCGSEARVNGKSIGSCLADEFAWALADFIDNNGVEATLGDHYDYLLKNVERSPVQWFAGDASFKSWKLSEFFSQVGFTAEQDAQLVADFKASKQKFSNNGEVIEEEEEQKSVQLVSSRDIDLHYLSQKYLDIDQQLGFEERITVGEQLLQEVTHRVQADKRFTRIAAKVLALQQESSNSSSLLGAVSAASLHTMNSDVAPVDCGKCCINAYKFISNSSCKFTDYSLKYAKTIHNLCTIKKDNFSTVMTVLQQECQL